MQVNNTISNTENAKTRLYDFSRIATTCESSKLHSYPLESNCHIFTY